MQELTGFISVLVLIRVFWFVIFNLAGVYPLSVFWRWLKGSRKVYGLCDGKLFEVAPDNSPKDESFLEIVENPFYKRARIFGKNSGRWVITGIRINPFDDVRTFYLQDRGGQSMETVLKVVNSGLSFPALVDRITELERDLKNANERRRAWNAAVKAILEIVDDDRPKYRSKSSEHIRLCLEAVNYSTYFMCEPIPSDEAIKDWKNIFEKNV